MAVDHAINLLMAIEAVLKSQVPLDGGWHGTRLKSHGWPVGYIEVTSSRPVRGQAYYREEHRGLISIYHRTREGETPTPYEAFRLSNLAHTALSTGAPSLIPNFEINQFGCGDLIPRNEEGLTWGRAFIFTAITHEVTHG